MNNKTNEELHSKIEELLSIIKEQKLKHDKEIQNLNETIKINTESICEFYENREREIEEERKQELSIVSSSFSSKP